MRTWRSNPTLIRAWHLVTFLVIAASLVIQLVLVIQGTDVLVPENREPFGTGGRVVNFFSYFTVQANIVLAIGAATLIANPDRDGAGWRVLRFSGLLGIAVTGVVFVTVLRPLVEVEGLAAWTNAGFHYVSPLLGVLGWLLFGPRPRVDTRTLLWSLAWPIAWLVYTLIRGEIVEWYPYPFIDVNEHGYGTVLLNSLVVTVLFLALAFGAKALDPRLAVREPSTPTRSP